MSVFIKDIFLKEKDTEKDEFSTIMKSIIKDVGKMIKFKEKVFLYIKTFLDIKENLKMAKKMGKEN